MSPNLQYCLKCCKACVGESVRILQNENVYQNHYCVDITNYYYFQVVFEVAFNSAKGGYVALDDISFSPVYCSNQTGKSSSCCLKSFLPCFASLNCLCQYFQYLVVLCRCCLLMWPVPVGLLFPY